MERSSPAWDARQATPEATLGGLPASELCEAIVRGEFGLHFQPIVELESERIVGSEGLIRWHRGGQFNAVAPDVFIPEAEQNGAIVMIGDLALQEACDQLQQWHDGGVDQARVSVNVSIWQLVMSDFSRYAEAILEKYTFPRAHLTLELTETMYAAYPDTVHRQIHRLHELGLRLSLDDFGTRWSTFDCLQEYPADEIKIDRVFTNKILESKTAREIVRMSLQLADSLGIDAVVEGVASPAVKDAAVELGARRGQGFWFAGPQPSGSIWPLWKLAHSYA